MRIAYLDCFAGVAGDMLVGAALDAGAAPAALHSAVESLGLTGVAVTSERVMRAGLAGTKFRVQLDTDPGRPGEHRAGHAHRHLPEILAIIAHADVPERVRQRAAATFEAIAAVESEVHDQPVEHVHFHEVGAEDTIVDVVCACLAVELLEVERVYSSAVTVGRGTVECAHGTLPVPAPGTLGILAGLPIRSGGPDGECTTPTGAALLRVLVDEFEPELTWTPVACGYGAGDRDPDGHPNLLRLTVGEQTDVAGAALSLWEVACTLDTATGEQLGFLLDGLLARGAADAFAAPVHMKKSRPGHTLTALVDDAHRAAITAFLLEESSSLGVRMHRVQREVLERWQETVETELGQVYFKCARLPSGAVVRRPEEDEVARLAQEHGVSRREILTRIATD